MRYTHKGAGTISILKIHPNVTNLHLINSHIDSVTESYGAVSCFNCSVLLSLVQSLVEEVLQYHSSSAVTSFYVPVIEPNHNIDQYF